MLSALGEEAKGAFERGLQWSLSMEPEFLGAESRMMVLSGLVLFDRQRVPEVRKAFATPQGPDPIEVAFFAVVEANPWPITWEEPDPFQQYTPDALPPTLHDREWLDGKMAHAALAQSIQGRVEEPVLSWLRADFWGYNLNHQLLSWILCLKRGHRVEEAREKILRLAAKLGHEHDNSELAVFYDLYVESTVFLALAGFPMERLAPKFRHILEAQDADGGWWFTREPSALPQLIEASHLGASPLHKPPRHYSEEADPELAFHSLMTLHRGHSTALSLWGLGLLRQRLGAQPT